MKMESFKCDVCKKTKNPDNGIGVGYGVDGAGNKTCYDCCADCDRSWMKEKGKIVLYFSNESITNWPGTLRFKVLGQKKSRHNFGGTRTDFWFYGPDGFLWHGYQIGNHTQIAHCKRTKERNQAA